MSEAVHRRRLDRFWRVLLVLVAVAGVVRIGYVAGAKRGPCPNAVFGSIPTECALGDQLYYNAAANQLAAGHGLTEPFGHGPAADHPPLVVFAMAPVSYLSRFAPLSWFHDPTHLLQQRYEMALLGTALVLLVGLLGRAVGGDAVGLVAAGVAALYPNLWVNDGLVFSETVAGLTVVGALLLAISLVRRSRAPTAVALGVVCGLAALARAELVLYVVLLAVPAAWFARGASRRARLQLVGLALAGAVVVIGPWVGYNMSRFSQPTFLSTNDGLALAGSNCAPVYSGDAIGLTSLSPPCTEEPPPPGDQSAVSKAYRDKALHYMRSHVSRVPLVVAARIGRTWSVFRPLDMLWYNQGEGRERWVTAAGLVWFYPLLLLAVGGVVLLRRRRSLLWPLLVPPAVVTIASAATYGQTRFRAPAEPSIVVLAAVAAVAAWSWLRRDRARVDDPAAREAASEVTSPAATV